MPLWPRIRISEERPQIGPGWPRRGHFERWLSNVLRFHAWDALTRRRRGQAQQYRIGLGARFPGQTQKAPAVRAPGARWSVPGPAPGAPDQNGCSNESATGGLRLDPFETSVYI